MYTMDFLSEINNLILSYLNDKKETCVRQNAIQHNL